MPESAFSYDIRTNLLHRRRLDTGEVSSHGLGAFTFKWGCVWCLLPGGDIVITGGGFTSTNEATNICSHKDFAVTLKPPMLTARSGHGAVHNRGYLYVIGGANGRYLNECERFDCTQNRWEALEPLPEAYCSMSVLVLEATDSLYALGGFLDQGSHDQINRLCLVSLRWYELKLKLPSAHNSIACFKLEESQAYFLIEKSLYAFAPLTNSITHVAAVKESVTSQCGPSYYAKGTLYCSGYFGTVRELNLGTLE